MCLLSGARTLGHTVSLLVYLVELSILPSNPPVSILLQLDDSVFTLMGY